MSLAGGGKSVSAVPHVDEKGQPVPHRFKHGEGLRGIEIEFLKIGVDFNAAKSEREHFLNMTLYVVAQGVKSSEPDKPVRLGFDALRNKFVYGRDLTRVVAAE